MRIAKITSYRKVFNEPDRSTYSECEVTATYDLDVEMMVLNCVRSNGEVVQSTYSRSTNTISIYNNGVLEATSEV